MKPPYLANSCPPIGRPAGSKTANAGSYAPSVPMSVYRELAAELQATKAMVNSLSRQNHDLAQQNRVLKQEIHRAVQVTLTLGQLAGVTQAADFEPDATHSNCLDQVGRSADAATAYEAAARPSNVKRSVRPAPSAASPNSSISAIRSLAQLSKRLRSSQWLVAQLSSRRP